VLFRSKDTTRVIVTFINLNSVGEELDISPGDIISKISGKNVNSLIELKEIVNQTIDMNNDAVIDFESGSLGVFKKLKKIKILTPRDLAIELDFVNN